MCWLPILKVLKVNPIPIYHPFQTCIFLPTFQKGNVHIFKRLWINLAHAWLVSAAVLVWMKRCRTKRRCNSTQDANRGGVRNSSKTHKLSKLRFWNYYRSVFEQKALRQIVFSLDFTWAASYESKKMRNTYSEILKPNLSTFSHTSSKNLRWDLKSSEFCTRKRNAVLCAYLSPPLEFSAFSLSSCFEQPI